MFPHNRTAQTLLVSFLAVALLACSDGNDQRLEPTPWPGGKWEPEPPTYGMAVERNIEVTMDDGVILHARVGYPSKPGTEERATGTFPVLLTQNPYAGGEEPDPFFVNRGYIHAVTEVRGTGKSQLSAAEPDGPLVSDSRGHRDALDGVALVGWAADLPGSDGHVGLYGCSWLGIVQILTAGELDKLSPVKAMVPACAGQNYTTYFVGGVATAVVNFFDAATGLLDPKHAIENAADGKALKEEILAGGDRAFNRAYWLERTSDLRTESIVDNDIPTLLWTGWNALEGVTGAVDLYSELQNAASNRGTFGPMDLDDNASSGKFQIIVGPGGHAEGLDKTLQLLWYDHWIKGLDTGIDETGTGMHLFEQGADRWINQTTWPITDKYTPFYLTNDGLDLAAMTHSRQVAFGDPELAGNSVSYDSQPFETDQTIAGPIAATLFIRSSNANAHFVLTLRDIAPDGSETQVSGGGLIASARNLDPERSWYDANGLAIKPEGTFDASVPLTPEETYRLDIRLFPTLYRIPMGHRLRLVIGTQAATDKCAFSIRALTQPNPCLFNAQQLPTLEGGIYIIESDAVHASSLNVPLVDPASLQTARSDVTETSPEQSQPLDWGGSGR